MKESIAVIPGRADRRSAASPESITTIASSLAPSVVQALSRWLWIPGPPLRGVPGQRTDSLERRGEQQSALGPQLVLAARELERRAHADRALVGFAVVSDLLDGVVHPVVRQPHHGAEAAFDAEQAAHLGIGRLRLHLVDVLRGDAE